jgi:hypothetical protein
MAVYAGIMYAVVEVEPVVTAPPIALYRDKDAAEKRYGIRRDDGEVMIVPVIMSAATCDESCREAPEVEVVHPGIPLPSKVWSD